MKITAQECCNKIDEALNLFGTRMYYGKGPREAMDIQSIVSKFNKMSAVEVRDILIEVSKHPHGEKFVSEVLVQSQERSDQDFEILEQACPNGW